MWHNIDRRIIGDGKVEALTQQNNKSKRIRDLFCRTEHAPFDIKSVKIVENYIKDNCNLYPNVIGERFNINCDIGKTRVLIANRKNRKEK